MKPRKLKIIKAVLAPAGMVVFHTKVGPFRYYLSNTTILNHFMELNPNLLKRRDNVFDLEACEGKFLNVPPRKGEK